jgi:hypothetical protein
MRTRAIEPVGRVGRTRLPRLPAYWHQRPTLRLLACGNSDRTASAPRQRTGSEHPRDNANNQETEKTTMHPVTNGEPTNARIAEFRRQAGSDELARAHNQ